MLYNPALFVPTLTSVVRMSSNRNEDIWQRLRKPLVWSVVAAVAVYGLSIVLGDLKQIGESITKLRIIDWLVILGLSLLNYGLRFIRWEIYLRRLDCRINAIRSLAYYLAGFLFTTTPGKAGEAVRSLYLRKHGIAMPLSLAAFFTERFVDLAAMVILALIGAYAYPDFRWPVIATAIAILVLIPFVRASSFHDFIANRIARLGSQRIRTLAERLVELLRSSSILLRSGPLYSGLALAIVAWGAEGIALYIILQQLDVSVSVALAVGIYSISVLIGALSFIPGGLGTTEAIMILLLTLVGADYPTAVAATLVCRLATLWFAVAIGGVVVAGLEVGKVRNSEEKKRDKQGKDECKVEPAKQSGTE